MRIASSIFWTAPSSPKASARFSDRKEQGMFRNYLITALRNLTRHKLYSFINIAGLTVGLTCATFIILLLRDELSYDKWIPGTENLYRVGFTIYPPGQRPLQTSTASFPVPGAMLAEIPEVKAMAHLEARHMT